VTIQCNKGSIKMTMTKPHDLDPERVRTLHKKVSAVESVGARMAALSKSLVGMPYVTNPLIGSAERREQFTISMSAFDCVTFMETVLALALSHSTDEFTDFMRRIRYEGGVIEWHHRNHYMTGWIRNNERIGLIENLSDQMQTVQRHRVLNVLEGLAPKSVE